MDEYEGFSTPFGFIICSAAGIIAGIIICIISAAFLFKTEKNYINILKQYDYAVENIIEVSPNIISPANEDKLVHVSGIIKTGKTLTDSIVVIPQAVVLERNTETFQWKEIKDRDADNTKYLYSKVWNRELIDSSKFHKSGHTNPKHVKYSDKKIYSTKAALGKYVIKNVSYIQPSTVLQYLPYNSNFKIYNGFYYTGKNFDNPKIGDQKIKYSYTPSGKQYSIIAKQSGNTLTEMNKENNSLLIAEEGNIPAKDMLLKNKNKSAGLLSLYRILAIAGLFCSFNMMFLPLSLLEGKVYFLKGMTLTRAFRQVCILTISTAFTISGINWISYKPIIGLTFIIAAVLLVKLLNKKKKIIVIQ